MAKTYAAKKVQLVFKGIPITGFMEDSFIEVDRNSDSFTLMVGADGEGARAASADKSAKITIRLLQTSASNDVLTASVISDELTNVGSGPLMIKDGSGRSLDSAAEAWVTKPAKKVYSKGIEGREWVLETDALLPFAGGN